MTPRRVLIVDDNALNVELAQAVLSHGSDFAVDTASDAIEALELIERRPPDLILMDIQMPGMDGVELTKRLKADPLTSGIVIVAFTALAMQGDEARLRAAGCDGYISKPIDVRKFAAQVSAFLARG